MNCTSLEYIDMSENQTVPTVDSSAFEGILPGVVSIKVPYEKLGEYATTSNWAALSAAGRIKFITSTNPTAELVLEDGSRRYLTGKNILQAAIADCALSTVEATIGYLNGEPA